VFNNAGERDFRIVEAWSSGATHMLPLVPRKRDPEQLLGQLGRPLVPAFEHVKQ